MNTKLNIMVLLVMLFAAVCPALTELQTFDGTAFPTGWTAYIGANSNSSYSWKAGLTSGGYLSVNLARNCNDDGMAQIYFPLGSIYPAGTTAGNVQESWYQFDVRCMSGSSSQQTAAAGIFNSNGDADHIPADVNNNGCAGIRFTDVNTVHPRLSSNGYGRGLSYRVKIHVYNSSSTTSAIWFQIYGLNDDGSTGSLYRDASNTFLGTGDSLPNTMDCFGIRNIPSDSSTASGVFLFDNMYFSTESEFTGTMPAPSWSIFQTFDGASLPEDWTAYMGSGSNGSHYLHKTNALGGYLRTNLHLSQNDDGVAKIYTPVGDIYPKGTAGGSAAESWMQFDVMALTGPFRQTISVGLFNSDGDMDNDPNLVYTITTVGLLSDDVNDTIRVYPRMGSGSSSGGGRACRVKMHIYNSGPTSSGIEFKLYSIDSAGNVNSTAFYTGTGSFIKSTDPPLAVTLDSFGIKNGKSSSTASGIYLFDNMYFSTEGEFAGTVPTPSWVADQMPSDALTMIAEPESREVFSYGSIMPTSSSDANISRLSYTDDTDGLYDGALVLAFKLPAIPAGKVINGASIKWYYKEYYTGGIVALDLYGIPYRPAATSPVVTTADHYVGTNDTTDAVRLQQNIAPVAVLDPCTDGYILQWVSSDASCKRSVGTFLQEQYLAGASAGDWVLFRFTPTAMMSRTRFNIRSPWYSDPNYYPYIAYEIVDASVGYWKSVTLETPTTITDTGVLTTPWSGFGCFYTDAGIFENTELVVPFKFPQLGSGEYVKEVELTGLWGGRSNGGGFDADLYGLPYRSSTAFQSSDYWVGPYAPQTGDVPDVNCGTPIASDVFDGRSSSSGGTWSIDPNGALRAACYMNSLKTAGATSSDYGFFRFGERFDFYRHENNVISGFSMFARIATEPPTCLDAPETEGACLKYSHPDRLFSDDNGDCKITLLDLTAMAEHWMQ